MSGQQQIRGESMLTKIVARRPTGRTLIKLKEHSYCVIASDCEHHRQDIKAGLSTQANRCAVAHHLGFEQPKSTNVRTRQRGWPQANRCAPAHHQDPNSQMANVRTAINERPAMPPQRSCLKKSEVVNKPVAMLHNASEHKRNLHAEHG